MIVNFKCRETRRIFYLQISKKFPADIQQVALRKLKMLNSAIEINDLSSPPGNRLERLKGSRCGQWSIRVNDKWRICFLWDNGFVSGVEIVDYH